MSHTENIPLPEQNEGSEKNIESTIETTGIDEAKALYQHARAKLLDVNRWHDWAGALSAEFQLTDHAGQPTSNIAIGSYFKIDIPGPGSSAGKGYDWVRVEEIKEDKNTEDDFEYTLIRVRPSDNPVTSKDDIAHFFSDKSTSNFVIKRDKQIVIAAVYGRNEIANTSTNNTIDKARNAIVGVSAVAGVSNAQWKSLTDGVLKTK